MKRSLCDYEAAAEMNREGEQNHRVSRLLYQPSNQSAVCMIKATSTAATMELPPLVHSLHIKGPPAPQAKCLLRRGWEMYSWILGAVEGDQLIEILRVFVFFSSCNSLQRGRVFWASGGGDRVLRTCLHPRRLPLRRTKWRACNGVRHPQKGARQPQRDGGVP